MKSDILDAVWFVVTVFLIFYAFGGLNAYAEDYRIEIPLVMSSGGCGG